MGRAAVPRSRFARQEEQGKLPPPPPPPRIMLNGSFKLEGDSKFEGAQRGSLACGGHRNVIQHVMGSINRFNVHRFLEHVCSFLLL